MAAICKFYDAIVKTEDINEADRTIVGFITTEAIDRDNEVVIARGVDESNFRMNPVVAWCHDYKVPSIGKNLWIKPGELNGKNGLIAKTKYATTPRADEIWQLRKGGFLQGYSIGFLPKTGKYGPPTESETKAFPTWKNARTIIREWELLEYSDVLIPCNQEALARAWASKSLKISMDLAHDLRLDLQPDPPAPEPDTKKVYFLSDTAVRKALAEELEEIDFKEIMAESMAKIPEIVKEQLRLARGGV